MRPMSRSRTAPSLRRRLLFTLLGVVAAIWIATAIASYFDARHELDELLDAHLAQAASLLIAQAGDELDEIDEHAPQLHRYVRRVAFQLWERGEVLRLHSTNAPSVRLSRNDEGFSDARIDGERWRVFSGWDRRHRYLVQVGERADARGQIVATILKNALWPLALALPLLAILVWIVVDRAMRPLRTLSREVAQRAPGNLASLALGDAPVEVAPLVVALDRLLARVHASIEGERRFTADAAHELRTPLAALRAQAQVARTAADAAERTRALDNVIAGCDRATHLVEQLLTLARLEPETARAERHECDLRIVVADAIAQMAPAALASDVAIELEGDATVHVRVDERLLAILFRNLLDNALRYSPSHTVVRVDVGCRDGVPYASIRDAGPGVPAEQRAELGRRFHRLAAASGVAGSGLGLSIAKRIADLHGASLVFDAAQGGGLVVTVRFADDGASPQGGNAR
jgi:two-component system, OmpR family, sensor kinase